MVILIEVAMILRVYAMYNRSGIVFGVLIMLYIAEIVILFVGSSFYSDPTYATGTYRISSINPCSLFTRTLKVSVSPLLSFTVCHLKFSTQRWNNASTIVQCILAAVLYICVMVQFARESLQMYRATRNWRLNKYMSLLVRDGLLYFLVCVSFPFLSV